MFRQNPARSAPRRRTATRRYTPYSLYRRALRIEPLEDRRLLAVITVNSLSDFSSTSDPFTTLREAVATANLQGGIDTIEFAPVLTETGPATILLSQGELLIKDSLTISGPGDDRITVSASRRIFNIDDGTSAVIDVSISGLRISGALTDDGGAILTRESLAIDNTTIDNLNRISSPSTFDSVPKGGGIAAFLPDSARLLITNSIISNNQARAGGGLYIVASTNSEVRITDTQIFGNSTLSGLGSGTGFGGGLYAEGPVTIERTSFVNNTARLAGGGLYHVGSATAAVKISDSEFASNNASSGGGLALLGTSSTYTISGSQIRGNNADRGTASDSGIGGGIYAGQGSLTVVETTIDDNFSTRGGGGIGVIVSSPSAHLTIEASTISNNTSEGAGGGILSSVPATIRQSTISGNHATVGGGAYIADATLVSSTVAENVASTATGGVQVGHSLGIDHSIVAGNTNPVPSGDLGRGTVAVVTASYSLVGKNNSSGLAGAPVGAPDSSGNLVGGPIHGVIDPQLRPLGDYGGPTRTQIPAPGSPVINAGNPAFIAGQGGVPLYDQSGEPFDRVIGGRIDIGAVEFGDPPTSNFIVSIPTDEFDGNFAASDLSLREAVRLANLSPDANTIQFSTSLTQHGPAVILLTRGALEINGSVAIVGPASRQLTIDSSGNDSTLNVRDGKGSSVFIVDDTRASLLEVSLSNLALTGGDVTYGGAILSAENLSIANCTITGNYATELGGGIAALYGTTRIENSSFNNNGTAASGGGLAILSGKLEVVGSTISGNTAQDGGGIHAYDAEVSIDQSLLAHNSAEGLNASGGAVFHKVGKLVVSDSTVSGNSASIGAGVYSADDAEITRSTITGNQASRSGGGLYSFGQLNVRQTTISANSAALDGGGLHAGDQVAVESSTISGNHADRSGGGIALNLVYGQAAITNSTISGNTAAQSGGGVWLYGYLSGTDFSHNTIYQNSVSSSMGAGGGIFLSAGALNIEHTIVAANSAHTGPDLQSEPTTAISVYFNFIGDGADSGLTPSDEPDGHGNIVGGSTFGIYNPQLGPLADNGGPTMTHALLPGSLAINAGDPGLSLGAAGLPTHDQRGAPHIRIYGGRIDIGAFEAQPDMLLGDYTADGFVDTVDYLVWRKSKGSTTDLRADGDGNGVVDEADYTVWRINFGETRALTSSSSSHLDDARPVFIPASRPTIDSTRPAAAVRHALVARSPVASELDLLLALEVNSHPDRKDIGDEAFANRHTDSSDSNAAIDSAFAAFSREEVGTMVQ